MATEDDTIKTATSVVALMGELIKAAGDNPEVKEAGKNLGKTALTITKAINNALLPLAAVNFGFDKAKKYFSEKFEQDLSDKVTAIPIEHILEPKASIAGPALQGLAFAHEELNLKDMYLSLLATAMDGRVASEAHPAFVEIIKQLDSEEASAIRKILQTPHFFSIVEVLLYSNNGLRTVVKHMLDSVDIPIENPKRAAMVDNWIRLGLVDVNYDRTLAGIDAYAWVSNMPELLRCRQKYENDTDTLDFRRGIIGRTAFGEQFAKVVGLA